MRLIDNSIEFALGYSKNTDYRVGALFAPAEMNWVS